MTAGKCLSTMFSRSFSSVNLPSDQVYLQAAAIFQQLHKEKPAEQRCLQYEKKTNMPLLENENHPTQRQAYQLAFNTLKCKIYQNKQSVIIFVSKCSSVVPVVAHNLPEERGLMAKLKSEINLNNSHRHPFRPMRLISVMKRRRASTPVFAC